MAYRTQAGRRVPMVSAATNGHQRVVSVNGTVVMFECKAGHRMTRDYSKGPVSKRMDVRAVALLTRYWKQGNGFFAQGWCQKCRNLADGVTE